MITPPRRGADCAGALLWVFKALGNLPRWDRAKPNELTTRPGLLAHAGPCTHRREFPPVIPQRVAPQQSPLPLHRIECYTSLQDPRAIPRAHSGVGLRNRSSCRLSVSGSRDSR